MIGDGDSGGGVSVVLSECSRLETMRLPIGEGLIRPSVQGGSRISSVHSAF
jgi:hypothetical protein